MLSDRAFYFLMGIAAGLLVATLLALEVEMMSNAADNIVIYRPRTARRSWEKRPRDDDTDLPPTG